MTWLDWLWEFIDNALFLAHCAAVVLLGLAAIACPIYLQRIHGELVIIRECAQKDVTVIDVHPAGPGPILPRVLPRLRNLREEAPE